MEKSVPSAKKKFSIRDIMTIAAMMVICFIIMMVMSSLTLPFPLVYLYGSAGIDGFICAVFFLVAANRVNKHGLLFAWAGIYSYTAMALESGFTSETLEMQMAMVTSPALMLLGAAITAVLTFLGTLFGQRLLRKHFQKAGIVG